GDDLVGVVVCQTAVAGVDQELHLAVPVEQVVDAFGTHGGLVVHVSGSGGPGPDRAAAGVGGDGGLDGVLFLLAGDERSTAGSVRRGSADLDLGTVQPNYEALGGGVGQHVGQSVQAYSGGGGEPAAGQQREDLADRGGDGGAVHAVEHGQGLVR